MSQCPGGTYYDYTLNECTICNGDLCNECVKTASTCTRCNSPLALDASSFTCRPCCSRSIHGKVSATTCCDCPTFYNGYCAYKNHSWVDFHGESGVEMTSPSNNLFFYFLITVAIVFLVGAMLIIKPLFRKKKLYGSVVYSALDDST